MNPPTRKSTPATAPASAKDGRPRALRRMAVALALIAFASPALAQDDLPTLDELLDLAPPQPPASEPSDPSAAALTPQPSAELDPAVERMLNGDNPADTLEQALAQMDEVALRLGRDRDAGLTTQRQQEAILDKLDRVIAAARRQQQSGGSSSGSSGSASPSARTPSAGGGAVAGQSGASPSAAAAGGVNPRGTQSSPGDAPVPPPTDAPESRRPLSELRREWGGLPPRLRDELTEGLGEQFSPVYRELTEAYYRRLAEE